MSAKLELIAEIVFQPNPSAMAGSKLCGAEFVCTSGPPGSCWCHHSPNLLESWDLAGECVCPDCLALGKREEMLAKREENFALRRASNPRKN